MLDRRGIKFVVSQQREDETDKLPGGKDECAFSRSNSRFQKLFLVESHIVRVVQTDLIGGFDQIVTKVAIAGLDQMGLILIYF